MSFQPSPSLSVSSTTGTSTNSTALGAGSNEAPGSNTTISSTANDSTVVASKIDNTQAYFELASTANSPNSGSGLSSTQTYVANKLNVLNSGTTPSPAKN